MEEIVRNANNGLLNPKQNSFLPLSFSSVDASPLEDEILDDQQRQLSGILENAKSFGDAIAHLKSSALAGTAWEVEKWEPAMLETAIAIAQKWKNGFN